MLLLVCMRDEFRMSGAVHLAVRTLITLPDLKFGDSGNRIGWGLGVLV